MPPDPPDIDSPLLFVSRPPGGSRPPQPPSGEPCRLLFPHPLKAGPGEAVQRVVAERLRAKKKHVRACVRVIPEEEEEE